MRARLVPLLLILATACTAGPGPDPIASGPEPCRARAPVSRGQRLPDCSFERLGGGTVALADFRGEPLVLNFWAEWCVACRREMPDFEAVHGELGDRVAFLGMDLLNVKGETRAIAEGFAATTGVTYTLAYDTDAHLYGHFGNALNPAMPLTLFVDDDGRLADLHFGQVSAERLRDLIRDSLGVG